MTDELPDSEVWVASGDVRIPLVKMGDSHLRNATNYMRKAIIDSMDDGAQEDVMEEMADKLIKLEGETKRRLNDGPKSLPITKIRRQAEETYRRLKQ